MTAKKDPNTGGPEEVPPPIVNLKPLRRERLEVPIAGTAPLIVHRFDEKAKRIMLEAQQTKARNKREVRDPVADYEASMYRLPGGAHGYPAVAFKGAIIDACSLFDGITKVAAKRAVFVVGNLVEILTPEGPSMREDMVRLARGTGADLRYRAEYWPWRAVLEVVYLPSVLDRDSVYALIDAAGNGGVGEWRPSAPNSSTGSFGTWEVEGDV